MQLISPQKKKKRIMGNDIRRNSPHEKSIRERDCLARSGLVKRTIARGERKVH